MILLGAALGSLSCGHFMDWMGRARCLLFANLCSILFSIMLACGFQPILYWWIVAGRFGMGVSSGILMSGSALYITETSDAADRGKHGMVNQLLGTFGIMLASLTGLPFLWVSEGWRYMFLINTIPCILQLTLWNYMPESPRYFLMKGMREEARLSLCKLRSSTPQMSASLLAPVDDSVDLIEQELAEIELKCNVSTNQSLSLTQLWALRTPLVLGVMLSLFQQLTGINAVVYYGREMLSDEGFDEWIALLLGGFVVGLPQLVALFIVRKTIDQWGRRPLFLLSTGAQVGSLGILGSISMMDYNRWLIFSVLIVFRASYSVATGPITMVYMGEIFPTAYRAKLIAICSFVSWLANILITLLFPVIESAFSYSTCYFFFAGFAGLDVVFTFFCIPETKGTVLDTALPKPEL